VNETKLRTQAVAVVLPVHNEEELLEACLADIAASCDPVLRFAIPCTTVIVLDRCVDASEKIAWDWARKLGRCGGLHQATVRRSAGVGVGFARRTGFSTVLRSMAGTEPGRVWLATTDADSRVPENWVSAQVAAHEGGADIWSGRVMVEDWSHYEPDTEERWRRAYDRELTPIHGASLGFNGQAYLNAGGFSAVRSGEDRALHGTIVAQGGRAFEDDETRVVTSGRRHGRAPLGFSCVLSSLDRDRTTVVLPRQGD
jgi:glycosyltransferase involved in cell wall biosynthesis